MEKKIDRREQLLSYIVKHIVFVYIKRAISDGPVENLGAFIWDDPQQPHTHKGWIVKVTTRTKKVIYVSVMVDEEAMRYRLSVSEEIKWKNWQGDGYEDRELYTGDNPELYSIAKEQESRNGTD
jgi:hypothetical protein